MSKKKLWNILREIEASIRMSTQAGFVADEPLASYRPWCSRKPGEAIGKGFMGSAGPYAGRLE